jgi:hypothetical protein
MQLKWSISCSSKVFRLGEEDARMIFFMGFTLKF